MGNGHAWQKFSPHCANGPVDMCLGYLQMWPGGGWHNGEVEGGRVLEDASTDGINWGGKVIVFFEMKKFSFAMVSKSK